MKIDKEVAFKLLKDLENEYPFAINAKTRLSEAFGKIYNQESINQQIAYCNYLEEEGLVKQSETTSKVTLTSKAINLLTDGIDMETYIKRIVKEK